MIAVVVLSPHPKVPASTRPPFLVGDQDHRHGLLLSLACCSTDYRSPGHHVDGGSLADIFVVRSATRRLRL